MNSLSSKIDYEAILVEYSNYLIDKERKKFTEEEIKEVEQAFQNFIYANKMRYDRKYYEKRKHILEKYYYE